MQYLLSTSGLEFRELFSSVSTFGWAQHARRKEKKKARLSIPASTVSVLNHERRRLLMRLIHIMMYFTSYSQQIHCNMSFFMHYERYMSTRAYEGWGSLNNWPILHLMCWRRRERIGNSHRLLLPNPPDLRSTVNSTPINMNITRLMS